jgi:hypothetical protein
MEAYVDDWNSHYINVFIPNIIWNILCLLLGVIGNSCVLFIYIFKMKQHREDRYFIPILAWLDLMASFFASIYQFTDYLYFVTYPSSGFCTAIVFLSFCTSALSGHCLLLVGIQRYLKICRPRGFQMTLIWRRVAILIIMCVAIGYSVPILIAAGNRSVDWTFKGRNVTGIYCSMNVQDKPEFRSVFYPAILVIIIANIIATTTVYIPVGCAIYKTFYKKNETSWSVNSRSSDSIKVISADNNFSNELECKPIFKKHLYGKKKTEIPTDITKNVVCIGILYKTQCNLSSSTKTSTISRRRTTIRGAKTAVNFNSMFLAIVLFYMLSYIPTGIMFIVSSKHSLYWFKLPDIELCILMWAQRIYIVNHVVNPLIYGYFDIYFRESIKSIFKCKTQTFSTGI